MKRRCMMCLIAGCMLFAFLCGCSSKESFSPSSLLDSSTASSSKAPVKIGVLLKTLSSEYWTSVAAGAQAAAAEENATLDLQAAASETAVDEQLDLLQTMLADSSLQAIIVAPLQAEKTASALASVELPVLSVDSSIPSDKVLCTVGTDNEAAAAKSGKYAAKQAIKAGSKTPYAVCIGGVEGDSTAKARLAGYKAGFEEAGGKVLEMQYGNASTEKVQQIMTAMLQKYDKLDAVLCHNDAVAIVASQVAVQQGREGLIACGFDATTLGCTSILDGIETFSVAQKAYDMGYQVVQAAVKAANGKKLDEFIDTGSEIITQDSAKTHMEDLKRQAGEVVG